MKRLLSTLTIIALLPNTALAHYFSFCARPYIEYTDNNYGEDYFVSDGNYYGMPGAAMRVRYYPTCSTSGAFNEYVPTTYADENGCTPVFNTPYSDGCFLYTVSSYGVTPYNNTSLKAYGSDGLIGTWSYWVNPETGGAQQQFFDFPEIQRFRVYVTLAYAVESGGFTGGYSGETIRAYATDDDTICGCGSSGNRSCTISGDTHICLTDSGTSQKFLIAHEYGHANLRMTAGSYSNDCSEGGDGHGMTTREYQSCAMMEGWADFVSADIWNADAHLDGKLRYWGSCGGSSTIDIESSGNGATCDVGYMEANYASGLWPGHASELDWMRTYWDHHTNSSSPWGGSAASHTLLQDEFATALPSTNTHMYDDYRQGVADASGCAQYERVVALADANGANHCEGEGSSGCDNVVGCTDID